MTTPAMFSKRLAFLFVCILATGSSRAGEFYVLRDIEYAVVGDHSLKLDLYLPESKHSPLIVWVHGGA